MAELSDEQAAKLVADARRAARLAFACVCVAVLLLVVDNQIKRHVVTKANEARAYLDRFGEYARQVMDDGQGPAGPGGAPDAAGDNADHGVVGAAAAGPDVAEAAGGVDDAAAAGRAGGAGGPRGNG